MKNLKQLINLSIYSILLLVIGLSACNKPKQQNKRLEGNWTVDHGGDCNVSGYKPGEYNFNFISTSENGGKVESSYNSGSIAIGYYVIKDATHMTINCGLLSGDFETSSIGKDKFSISGTCKLSDRSVQLAFTKQ